MNNIVNTESGERLSFYKLFKEKQYRIQIPIIQRDYAQGRKTSKEVRDTFLNALYKYLDEDKPNRDLDFVYGSLNKVNGVVDFIPLDGQQRLTTLYLLHWYLYQISDNEDQKNEYRNILLKDGKSMFTYETRSSSSDFCDALMGCNIDFNNLLKSDKDLEGNSKHNSLSKTIKNSAWFYLSWKYDPSIQAMLIMLDAIHLKFNNRKDFFERLLDTESPIITFLFLNLKDFNLTDDLYIKMNSRGKPLTAFENFKAKFEQYLENINIDKKFKLEFIEQEKGVEKDASLKEYFSFNIDTKWANLFWNYRTLQKRIKTDNDDNFDDELMNFIRVIFTSKYAGSLEVSSKEKDDTLEYLLGTNVARKEHKDYSDIISYHKYKELDVLFDKEEEEKYAKLIEKTTDEKQKDRLKNQKNKIQKTSIDCVLQLIDTFDCLHNGNDKIKLYLNDSYKFYFNEQKAFENALRHNFDSNHQRLCFHAYILFLINNRIDHRGINQWMRVIHNLTHPDNNIIDNASEVATAIQSIESIISHSSDILDFLKTDPDITLAPHWQVLEEKIKAHLITKSDNWKNKIEEAEKHGYFNGQIAFLLEFAGIIDYYNTYNNCDWDSQKDLEYFEKFSEYAEKASKIFEENYENRKNDKDYIFERAVLTKGDYLTSASINRKNLLSTNLVKNNIKRDHSWKRLLRVVNDKEWINRRMLVKQLFDDNRFDINKMEDSLASICQDNTNSWIEYFVDCPSLIDYCKQGFIRFENEHYILLYGQSQSNFYHVEMYTYYLWKKFIEQNKKSYLPFESIYYDEVKSIEEDACIVFNNFCLNRIYYEAKIYYCNNDKLPYPFEIAFRKSKGDNNVESYGEEITDLLNLIGFTWIDEYKGYFYTTNNYEDLLNKLKEITQDLKNLKEEKSKAMLA